MKTQFLALLLTVIPVAPAFSDRADQNLQRVLETGRSLEYGSEIPNQRAYLLVKTQSVRSPVALIFGYVDNLAGCLELATDLSKAANARGLPPGQDLYVCEAIY